MNRFNLLILLFFFTYCNGFSQTQTLKIWTDGVPNSISNPNYIEKDGTERKRPFVISNVSEPTIAVYLPEKSKANGTAIVICPGGGYAYLSYEHEGFKVAKWLNELGIAGIVLKYRLPNDSIMQNKSIAPLQDAQEAMRIVRRNAKDWNINPTKIGIMGFSAGGHLASTLSTHFNEKVYPVKDSTSARPDFSVLVYPVISMRTSISHSGSQQRLLGKNADSTLINRFSNELHVTSQTPPTYLIHSEDDKTVPIENSIYYYLAMKKNKVEGELHIYQKGGHGYNIAGKGGTESEWIEPFKKWLKVRGLL